jgi:hypothetical protein
VAIPNEGGNSADRAAWALGVHDGRKGVTPEARAAVLEAVKRLIGGES